MGPMTARVTEIHTYPVKGEPGTDLDECRVEPEGLAGDRRKKAALHLVAKAAAPTTRANLVLDLDDADLAALIGRQVRVGEVVVGVKSAAGSCPGVYAEVVASGAVHLGDVVVAVDPTPPR